MVTRCAVVLDCIVQNVVLVDPDADWTPPEGAALVELSDEPVSPGDTYDGQTFTPGDRIAATATVEVDPSALADLLAQAEAANTVVATRNALAALIQQLTP